MRSVLTELEARLRSTVQNEELVVPDLANLDIDHILPRSWFADWRLADGSLATNEEASEVEFLGRIGDQLTTRQKEIKDRQDSIGSLGNLTLLNLSVNRDAQNFAFAHKRDLLVKNTTLRLNMARSSEDSWNTETIRRAWRTSCQLSPADLAEPRTQAIGRLGKMTCTSRRLRDVSTVRVWRI